MRFKLKSMNGWASDKVPQDGIALINIIRSISNQHYDSKQGVMTIFQLYKRMYFTYQTPEMPNTGYLDQFKIYVDVIKAYNRTPDAHPGLTKFVLAEFPGVDMTTYPSGVTGDQAKATRKTACEKYLACLFISGDCNVRYGVTKRDFHNNYIKDKDLHPKKFEMALKYMNDCQTLNKSGRYKKPHRTNE